jgi:hypothetical protein
VDAVELQWKSLGNCVDAAPSLTRIVTLEYVPTEPAPGVPRSVPVTALKLAQEGDSRS